MNIEAQPENDFSQAFEQFSLPEGKQEEKPAEEQPAAEAPAQEQPAVEEPAAETPAEEQPAAEEPAAEPEAPVEEQPAAEKDEDILNRLAQAVADAKPKVEEKPAEQPAAQPEEERPLYSQDEQEFLSSYDKDWGDVVKGEALKRRAEYRDLLQYVFTEVSKALTPIKEVTDSLADRTFLQDVKANVPDYDDNLRDQVISWVKSQPAYLQAAYNQVIDSGTVDEVKDLVDRYRGATGQATATKSTDKKDKELSTEAKQAAKSLAPVESKRTQVQAPSDPDNFEDAWKQFAKDA